jgi:hypothetical protein
LTDIATRFGFNLLGGSQVLFVQPEFIFEYICQAVDHIGPFCKDTGRF